MAELRHVIITKNRDAQLTKGMKFASGGQHGEGFCMFGTGDGNSVIFGIPGQIASIKKMKSFADQFDALLGLTKALMQYDVWMHDNECFWPGEELSKAIKLLGGTWKTLIAKSDAELGIDSEFTRPGVVALLEEFKKELKSTPNCNPYLNPNSNPNPNPNPHPNPNPINKLNSTVSLNLTWKELTSEAITMCKAKFNWK